MNSFRNYFFLLPSLLLWALDLPAQPTPSGDARNYIAILPTDREPDIIHKAAHVVPSPRQLRWQQLELTAFFHFGMNTFTNQEWGNGKEDPSLFNPSGLDAGQWVRTAKEAGIKQVILTAKHHDGFCLWPSKFTEHSVRNSPWKNGKGDVVKEVAEACKVYGMGFGIYLSPWDRNSALYGDSEKYNVYFEKQLTELLTNYGRVDEVWFDGANGEGPNGKKQVYDFPAWYSLIRKLQPTATIAIMGPDVRWVGTESGQGRLTEWSVLPVDGKMQERIAAGSQKDITFAPLGDMTNDDLGSREKIMQAKGLVWYPAETDVSIRPGWFYHAAEDSQVKTPDRLLDIYFSSVGCNSLLLLNIPPDKNGRISDADIHSLQGWRKKITETFRTNLAAGATITASSGKGAFFLTKDAAFLRNGSSFRIEGKENTYWAANEKDSTATIEFDLHGAKKFDVLSLQENIRIGQRVEKFVLESMENGQWKKITEGTTIGYKRLIRFPVVTASRVRLRIESSRLNPTLTSFGIYKLAP